MPEITTIYLKTLNSIWKALKRNKKFRSVIEEYLKTKYWWYHLIFGTIT